MRRPPQDGQESSIGTRFGRVPLLLAEGTTYAILCEDMANWEHFPKAPIVEALLDVAVTFSSAVELGRLEAFHEDVRSEYPGKLPRAKWHGEIQVGEAHVQQAVRRGAEGFMFKSRDGHRIVQARQDGFAFNWLTPYESWEALRNEARKHWERYRETFRPEAVTRLGLRYINRIELPLPFTDFREFIKTAPDIAAGVPQGLSALFMRLEVPHPELGLLAIITETLEPTVEKEARKWIPILFDIDVVRSATFEPSSPAMWETFEQMRKYKNEIFFASVTEKAKEMFR